MMNFETEEFNLLNFKAFLNTNFPNWNTENSLTLIDFKRYKEQGKEFKTLQNAIDKMSPYFKEVEIDLIESGYIEKLRDEKSNNMLDYLPDGEFLCFAVAVTDEDSLQRMKNSPEDFKSVVEKWKIKMATLKGSAQ